MNNPIPGEPAPGVASTLAERGDRYGDFSGHAQIVQDLMAVMQNAKAVKMDGRVMPSGHPWQGLSPVQRQALTVIADKIARILNGDPNYKDNWHDIQGYAKLAEDRCDGPGPSNKVEEIVRSYISSQDPNRSVG